MAGLVSLQLPADSMYNDVLFNLKIFFLAIEKRILFIHNIMDTYPKM